MLHVSQISGLGEADTMMDTCKGTWGRFHVVLLDFFQGLHLFLTWLLIVRGPFWLKVQNRPQREIFISIVQWFCVSLDYAILLPL